MDRLVNGCFFVDGFRILVHREIGGVCDDNRGRGKSSDGIGDTVLGDMFPNHFFFVHSVVVVLTDSEEEGSHDEVNGE